MVAEQWIDNLLTGAGQLFIGAEEQQWVFQWHQRQGGVGGGGHQWPPDAHGKHHVFGFNVAFVSFHATYLAVLDINTDGRCVGKSLEFSAGDCLLHEVAGHCLGAGNHQPGVRIPHGALDLAFVHQREQLFRLLRRDHTDIGAEGLAGAHLAT